MLNNMKITNPCPEIRNRVVPEDLENRIKNKCKTRTSVINYLHSNDEQETITMKKIRFGDLKKDDVFEFSGKKMKKLEDDGFHAITLIDRGKESFMFFKHNLVNVEQIFSTEQDDKINWDSKLISFNGKLCNDMTFRQAVDKCRKRKEFDCVHIVFKTSSNCYIECWINNRESDEQIEQKFIVKGKLDFETIGYFGTHINTTSITTESSPIFYQTDK
jgi:hypothetical protein